MADGATPGDPPEVRTAVFAQTAVKPRNDSFPGAAATVWRANEDRFQIGQGPHGLFAAVADGAGSSGLYCGAWAETLVRRLPDHPIRNLPGLDAWLAGFSLDFRETHGARAAADPAKRAKFIREGSCATLAAAWLGRRGGRPSVTWLAYGDSPVMIFDRTTAPPRLVACHPGRLAAFDRDPQLLNWRDLPVAAGLAAGIIDLPAKAAVVLATDAVGQFLLLSHFAAGAPGPPGMAEDFRRLAGGEGRLSSLARAHQAAGSRSADGLEDLRRHLDSPADFAALVRRRWDDGLLANDDATVVMIEIETPPVGDDEPECHCRPMENPGS